MEDDFNRRMLGLLVIIGAALLAVLV
jgi:hypothetical protein